MNCRNYFKHCLLVFLIAFSFSIRAEERGVSLLSISDFTKIIENDSGYVIIDLRKSDDFKENHIRGALNIQRFNIIDSTLDYGGILASRESLVKLFSLLGVKNSDKIIIYDNKGGCEAARLWWILKTYGHQNTVILDGDYSSLLNMSNLISNETVNKIASNYLFPTNENYDYYASIDEVKIAIEDTNTILLDTRTIEEYLGGIQKNGAYRKGRIPTSIHLDWANSINYDGDKKFKSIKNLAYDFNKIGVTKDKKIIVYCQSGVRSAHTTFVLTQLLGYPNVKNYDGSWIEWSYNKSLPIDSGEVVLIAEVESLHKVSYSDLFFSSFGSYASYVWSEITFQTNPWYTNYFWLLIILSIVVWLLELAFPWRKNQPIIRTDFWIDAFYMFFNFFIFNLVIFIAFSDLITYLVNNAIGLELSKIAIINLKDYSEWLQLIIFFVATDFIQWFTHVLLHRFPVLWRFHKVHHSVEEMGFAAHLRYHWMENVFYTPMKYIMVMLIGGFAPEQAFIVYYFAIAIGHINHANIGISYGPLKYVLNNPKMHIWHHAYELPTNHSHGMNFGISLSIWDYIFRTNYIPHSGRDIKLGFEKIEEFPKTFFRQLYAGFKD